MLDAFRAGDQNWKIEEHPFLRSVADAWMVTTQVALSGGQVAAPNSQWLWEAVFDRGGPVPARSGGACGARRHRRSR